MSINMDASSTNELISRMNTEYPGKQIVLEFWATWCGPCRALAPILEAVHDTGDALVVKVDVDANPTLAVENNVQSIPTMLFLKDGEENKDRVVGVLSLPQLKEHLK